MHPRRTENKNQNLDKTEWKEEEEQQKQWKRNANCICHNVTSCHFGRMHIIIYSLEAMTRISNNANKLAVR